MTSYIVTVRSGLDDQDCRFTRAVKAESPEGAVRVVIRDRVTHARIFGHIEGVFLRDGGEIVFSVREFGKDDPVATFTVTMAVSIEFKLESES